VFSALAGCFAIHLLFTVTHESDIPESILGGPDQRNHLRSRPTPLPVPPPDIVTGAGSFEPQDLADVSAEIPVLAPPLVNIPQPQANRRVDVPHVVLLGMHFQMTVASPEPGLETHKTPILHEVGGENEMIPRQLPRRP
jgi:hypothetical protein